MINIDGHDSQSDGTVLDACRAVGAHVPALCHDGRVAAGGHCRSCLVELDGRLVAACTTKAKTGGVVRTETEALRTYRQDLAELILSEASPAGEVATTLARMGGAGVRYRSAPTASHGKDASHPYLRLDLDRCILCRLCVRVCSDVQGQFVFAVKGRGADTKLTWGEGIFASTDCVSCGACASICPTSAISDTDRLRWQDGPAAIVRTTCSYCGVGCQMDVHVAKGAVARIEGAPSPVNREHLCVKGRYAHGFSRHPDRLQTPLLRKGGRLEPVGWDEALAYIAAEMNRLRGRLGFLSSSRCTNEENYLVQKWARAGFHSNNVDCCARVCHGPSAVGLRKAFGTGAATNSLADIEMADLFLVSGSNTTEAHPVTGARIKQAVLNGARLVVVDPRRTELARMADLHLQLRPGTNVALYNSMAAVIVDEGLVDQDFLAARTDGFDVYQRFIRGYLPERVEGITGVPALLVRKAARLYAQAKSPMQAHGLGMTEHFQGSEGVMTLANLALLVGAVGRPGTGVNPLRGQNNVQGAADMGCQPDLLTGYQDPRDPGVAAKFFQVWGRPVPVDKGLTIPRLYDGIRKGDIAGLYILGEDVAQTDPDGGRVIEALDHLELLVVQELFLSETAKHAHVVLPGASFLEKDGTFTNGERRIQRVRQVIESPGDARADWRIVVALMNATGLPATYENPAAIMDEIARLSPSYRGVSYDRLDGDGLQWPVPTTSHPGTDILHTQSFSGHRATLCCVDYEASPVLEAAPAPLLLITGRVLEHYNSGTMTRRSPNLALAGRDILQIHPHDAMTRGIADGTPVEIESRWGRAHVVALVTDVVAPGVVFTTFHFPESTTNAVTSDVVDRLADCPEYKLTPVEVRVFRE